MSTPLRYDIVPDHPDRQNRHVIDKSALPERDVRADSWDADKNFMKIDSWSESELLDESRFRHYLARLHVHGGKR